MAGEEKTKLTYDQLNEVCMRAIDENKRLKASISNQGVTFKRIEFLFDILKFSDKFNSDIVTKAVEEIEETMYPNDDEKNE